ncbi:MAG TPA: hypothetical protein VE546_23675 [Streptomyces sp.]|uniref:hypothetical protein n=1 Tax=Streptomyces sp. TaxID=1931 RepID=UPI002D5B21EB|nr:hypothetical protein [Streptomyces sp.]HZG06535.1 hypothetical protein [Streptomyces sp.]
MLSTLLGVLAVPVAFAVGTGIWNVLFRPPGSRDLWVEQERYHHLRTVVAARPHQERPTAPPSRKDWHIAA